MRVLVKSGGRSESGAVALMVGLLAVVLLGIAAFTADFGMAYVNKRQIQTAADAAALGAASVYSSSAATGGCSTVLSTGRAAAAAEAASKVAVNDNDGAPASHVFDPTCDGSTLKVTVTTSADSQSFLGGLFGHEKYEVTRSATAVVAAATSIGPGLRPLALCSRDLLALTAFPTPVMKFEGPSGGPDAGSHTDCPDTMRPGNWWTLDCPENAANGDLAANILNGCTQGVSIVPGQPAPTSPTLTAHLNGYCAVTPLRRTSCLTANPGNLRDSNSLSALKTLVDSEKQIYLPSFCGTPTCDPGAVSTDGGGNTVYPVFRIISVRLCGYHLGNGATSTHSKMTGACSNNPGGFNVSSGGPNRNYLLVSVLQTNVSGSTAPSACAVGDPCDTGLRQVRMTG